MRTESSKPTVPASRSDPTPQAKNTQGTVGLGPVSNSDAIHFLEILNGRFVHLTHLRTANARRHVTIVGLAGGAFLAALKLTPGRGSTSILSISDIAAISIVLAIMSIGVVVYDGLIRHRARAAASAMAFVVDNAPPLEGAPGSRGKTSGIEDYFYFFQILVLSALTFVLPTRQWITRRSYAAGLETSDVVAYCTGLIFFSVLWKASTYYYEKRTGRSTWLPSA